MQSGFCRLSKNGFYRFFAFLVYWFLFYPWARLALFFRYRHRVIGKRCMRGFRRRGMFLVGNRTGTKADVYIPTAVTSPKRAYVIVDGEKIRHGHAFRVLCGAVPTPAGHREVRGFLEVLEKHTVQKDAVAFYPARGEEGLSATPFTYPVRFDEPVFVLTTVAETKGGKARRLVTYVDGPFYADTDLPLRKRTAELARRAQSVMRSREGGER